MITSKYCRLNTDSVTFIDMSLFIKFMSVVTEFKIKSYAHEGFSYILLAALYLTKGRIVLDNLYFIIFGCFIPPPGYLRAIVPPFLSFDESEVASLSDIRIFRRNKFKSIKIQFSQTLLFT